MEEGIKLRRCNEIIFIGDHAQERREPREVSRTEDVFDYVKNINEETVMQLNIYTQAIHVKDNVIFSHQSM